LRRRQVIVGAHTLLANGGIMAPVGTALVAMAAKKHAVPFVVLVGLHKLSPLYPHDPDVTFNEFKSPAAVVDYDVVAEPLEQHAAAVPEASPASSDLPASCVTVLGWPSCCNWKARHPNRHEQRRKLTQRAPRWMRCHADMISSWHSA
jgi:translation initiation factor 2B subunit (eIF-2B alpha/beta/delta family)